MSIARKLIAATFALIVTLATTALIFAPVALAARAPVVRSERNGNAAVPQPPLSGASRRHESVRVPR